MSTCPAVAPPPPPPALPALSLRESLTESRRRRLQLERQENDARANAAAAGAEVAAAAAAAAVAAAPSASSSSSSSSSSSRVPWAPSHVATPPVRCARLTADSWRHAASDGNAAACAADVQPFVALPNSGGSSTLFVGWPLVSDDDDHAANANADADVNADANADVNANASANVVACCVLKGSSAPMAELAATQLARRIGGGVRVPPVRVVRYAVDREHYAAIELWLRRIPAMRERCAAKRLAARPMFTLTPWVARAVPLALAVQARAQLQMELGGGGGRRRNDERQQRALVARTPPLLLAAVRALHSVAFVRSLGELLSLDVLLNNWDRLPLLWHYNDANLDNVFVAHTSALRDWSDDDDGDGGDDGGDDDDTDADDYDAFVAVGIDQCVCALPAGDRTKRYCDRVAALLHAITDDTRRSDEIIELDRCARVLWPTTTVATDDDDNDASTTMATTPTTTPTTTTTTTTPSTDVDRRRSSAPLALLDALREGLVRGVRRVNAARLYDDNGAAIVEMVEHNDALVDAMIERMSWGVDATSRYGQTLVRASFLLVVADQLRAFDVRCAEWLGCRREITRVTHGPSE